MYAVWVLTLNKPLRYVGLMALSTGALARALEEEIVAVLNSSPTGSVCSKY